MVSDNNQTKNKKKTRTEKQLDFPRGVGFLPQIYNRILSFYRGKTKFFNFFLSGAATNACARDGLCSHTH